MTIFWAPLPIFPNRVQNFKLFSSRIPKGVQVRLSGNFEIKVLRYLPGGIVSDFLIVSNWRAEFLINSYLSINFGGRPSNLPNCIVCLLNCLCGL